MPPNPLNSLAQQLKALHQPGNPVVLTNVWDAATASIAASHAATKALATASYAVAASSGVDDNDMTWPTNLARIRLIAPVAARAHLPLTVDLQDGYDDVATTVTEAIGAGAVGCNLEDVDNRTDALRPLDDAVRRIAAAKQAAADAGVPDFCINARTDVLYLQDGATLEDAVQRGKAFLAAGATTVFVWGGPKGRGVSGEEVGRLVEGLGGMVNVKQNLRPGYLTTKELRALGVARVSIGPELYVKAMNAFRSGLDEMLVA